MSNQKGTATLHAQSLHLSVLLRQAMKDAHDISWSEHHPSYPQSAYDFMSYLSRSGWMIGDYQNVSFTNVVRKLNQASLTDIRCALTSACRSEKWVTGSWIPLFQNNDLSSLIERAIIASASKALGKQLDS